MAGQSKNPERYENNPFFIAANGITLLFNLAKGIAILLVVLSVLSLFTGSWSPDTSNQTEVRNQWENTWTIVSSWTINEWVLAISAITIISLAIMLVSALFGGVSSYTSARVARGQKVSINEAFRVAFEHLWSYLWLQIIVFVKLFLWTLLFIIPGIIMAVRYSLAGVAFYDDRKHLRGNAAIKESLQLTKGAWITTFSANTLFNILTFGIISSLVTTSVNAMLYRQYDRIGHGKKPAAHMLSWLTLAIPFIIICVMLWFTILLAIIIGLTGQPRT